MKRHAPRILIRHCHAPPHTFFLHIFHFSFLSASNPRSRKQNSSSPISSPPPSLPIKSPTTTTNSWLDFSLSSYLTFSPLILTISANFDIYIFFKFNYYLMQFEFSPLDFVSVFSSLCWLQSELDSSSIWSFIFSCVFFF